MWYLDDMRNTQPAQTAVLVVVALSSFPLAASAQINYQSATRSMSAFAQGTVSGEPDHSASNSSGVFGFLDRSISASGVSTYAGAHHVSNLQPSQIDFSGTASAGGLNAYNANSSCSLSVNFSLSSPTPVGFRGSVSQGSFHLTRAGQDALPAMNSFGSYTYYGTLPAGSYLLQLECHGFNTSGPFDPPGSADITLTLPAAGTLTPFALAALIASRRRRA